MDITSRNVEETLLQIGREYLFLEDENALTLESDLAAMGLDSMNTIQMLLDIEAAFGVTIPDNMLTRENFTSLSTLSSVLHKLIEEGV